MPGIRAFLWVFLSLTVVAAALTTELPAPAAAAPGAEPAATLRLGIIDDPDNPQQTEVLKESAEALRKALPGLRIELSALGELELQKAVLDRKIDMYMLSAGFHAYVADLGGADLIAALKPPMHQRRAPPQVLSFLSAPTTGSTRASSVCARRA